MAAGQFNIIKDASLTITGTEHAATCDKALLVPEVNTQTRRMLVPAGTITDVDSAAWTLQVAGVQHWGTGGFSKYMHDNHGLEVELELAPKDAVGEPLATFTVIAHSGPFGGTASEWAEFDEEYGVVGQPEFTTVVS